MKRISAMLLAQAAEIEKLRESYQSACLLVADMHEAAMGGVMGPVLGVVEDVAALRAERDQLKAKNEKLVASAKLARDSLLTEQRSTVSLATESQLIEAVTSLREALKENTCE